MHAGGLEKELVAFIGAHRSLILARPRFLFVVLLSAATRDPGMRADALADAGQKIRRQLDVDFDDIEFIAGALMYSKYPRPLRWLMKQIAAKAGEETDTSRDYEYTDWQQVERYAKRRIVLG
jgi:menaquinone-dependent protoporphyrinogen oxidase